VHVGSHLYRMCPYCSLSALSCWVMQHCRPGGGATDWRRAVGRLGGSTRPRCLPLGRGAGRGGTESRRRRQRSAARYRPARRAPLGAAVACLPPRGDEPHVRPLALVVLPHPSARGLPAGLCPS